MSEIAESTPVTESAPPPSTGGESSTLSAPQSTSDIAAAVNDRLEREAAGTPKAETEKPPTAAELSRAAKFLVAQGHKWGKRDDGRTDLSWLPASTVEKMLDRYVEEHRGEWNGARTELERARDEATRHLQTLRSEIEADPDAYIADLAVNFPAYRKFLQQQSTRPAADDDPMPQPDYPLGEGKFTYSVEGLQKRDEWIERRLMRKVDERVKPLAERDKQVQERQQAAEARAKLGESVQAQISEAESWPGFGKIATDGTYTEFQTEILTELRKDSEAARAAGRHPTMSLRQAYLEVHARHLAADDAKKRAAWIEEQNKAPLSTSVTRQGVETTRQRGPRSIEEIAREVVSRSS